MHREKGDEKPTHCTAGAEAPQGTGAMKGAGTWQHSRVHIGNLLPPGIEFIMLSQLATEPGLGDCSQSLGLPITLKAAILGVHTGVPGAISG